MYLMKKKTPKKASFAKIKRDLWKWCSLYIKTRDSWRCYTCKSFVRGSNAHCGHFIPSSICGIGLRYDERNLACQCMVCNIHHSGNYISFRENLVKEHGEKYVKNLEAERHLTTKDFDYVAKTAYYKQKCDELGVV